MIKKKSGVNNCDEYNCVRRGSLADFNCRHNLIHAFTKTKTEKGFFAKHSASQTVHWNLKRT